MILELILAIVLGCSIGIITGLVPGIHVNLVSVLVASFSGVLLYYTDPIILAVFIVSLGITHTFLDAIPSIFLGAPDPDTVFLVLPGHRMLLEGNGYEAVKLSAIGAFICMVITLALIPIAIIFLPAIYESIEPYMAYILIFIALWLILAETGLKKKFQAFFIFGISGIFGLIVFYLPNQQDPLFPMLSGLFGISSLMLSLQDKISIPKQNISTELKFEKRKSIRAIFAGVFAGMLTGLFPAISSAQASVIGVFAAGKRIGVKAFIMLVGGIGTVNFAFSIATMYAISKARNGPIATIMEVMDNISKNDLWILIIASFIAGCIALILTFKFGKIAAHLIAKMNYRKLAITIICFILVLVILLSGFNGFIIALTATFIGILTSLLGVKRSHSMGCLMLPVVIYFLVG